ncbi:MAG TPA: benzoate-CoA ligase family protein [Pyrinomonadaceae bacterium]|nr:benzoate-CoA ligase family protein [Pyrinomonadaceae bacterium]
MNLVEYVFRGARESGRDQRPAILCEDRQLTYEQLLRQVKKFGGALKSLGVGPGDRVAIVAADCPEFVAAFLGTLAVGAVAVPASTLMSPQEMQYVLDHSGARAAVVTSEQLGKLQGIRRNLPRLESVLLVGGEGEGTKGFVETLAGADESEIEPLDDDTLAFILYTSGSTGRPKGAMHTHRNLPYTVETYCKHVLRPTPEDRLFSSSRLFFAYGLGNSLSFPLASCATSVLCKERPTPQIIASVFERHRPTIFFGVPAVFRALLEYAASGGALDTSSINLCVSAGEKLPERIFREWEELTGLPILDGIGSTEMLQMFISNRRGEVRVGSSGREVPGYEAKILNESGHEVTGEGEGALWIKGLSACAGYWNEPEKTAEAIKGEWVRTGDIYRRDAEGFYWFEGRGDDMFKVKGMWVSPVEVEDALLSCPDVLETAVVPRADADGLNSIVAFVVLKSASAGVEGIEAKLKAHAAAQLPPYKRPTEFRFNDALPRTATGKTQRFKLREELAKNG